MDAPELPVQGWEVVTGALICRAILELWQPWHCLHQFWMSRFMLLQTKRSMMMRVVGFRPGWLRPWMSENGVGRDDGPGDTHRDIAPDL